MGIFDKVCEKFGLADDEFEEEELREEEPKVKTAPFVAPKAQNNVVDIHSASSIRPAPASRVRVVVMEPKTFDDVQQVANALKEKKPVVINFEHTDDASMQRIIDFASGTAYAISGDIKKVGPNVFLCTPSNVSLSYKDEKAKSFSDMSWLKN